MNCLVKASYISTLSRILIAAKTVGELSVPLVFDPAKPLT
jgi:hypothetical protein